MPLDRIRRIKVTDGNSTALAPFLPDAETTNKNGIVAAVKHTDDALTVTFDGPESLHKFENDVEAKLGTNVVLSPVPGYQPTMKVVGHNDFLTPADDILAKMRTQNQIDENAIEFVRDYTIDASRRAYRNLIVKCSIEILSRATRSGLTFDGRSYRCFEQVQTLQCFKCYAFGHVATKCTNKIVCRKCAGNHSSIECTDVSGKFICVNCKLGGKPHDHKVTSETCPRRIARINGIIDFLESKTMKPTQTATS